MVQKNFILTDVMKTGFHTRLEQFIEFGQLPNNTFTMTGTYWEINNFNLNEFDRKIAIIDYRDKTCPFFQNKLFVEDFNKRLNVLKKQGFSFVLANPWESKNTIINLEGIESKGGYYIWEGLDSWFWWLMYNRYKDNTFVFDHSKKYFDFFYLNKTDRKHRRKLFDKLQKNNLLNNSLISYLDMQIKLPSQYELPWVDPVNYPRYGYDRDIYERPYNETAVNIVSETEIDNIFLTEKIWKAIIARQIFVVHSCPLYLERLQILGFKTFTDFIDESYDTENDNDVRIDKIVNSIKKIKSMDYKKLYESTKDIRNHNYKNFFNEDTLRQTCRKTIQNLLKFFDSR